MNPRTDSGSIARVRRIRGSLRHCPSKKPVLNAGKIGIRPPRRGHSIRPAVAVPRRQVATDADFHEVSLQCHRLSMRRTGKERRSLIARSKLGAALVQSLAEQDNSCPRAVSSRGKRRPLGAALGRAFQERLGQAVVVENKPAPAAISLRRKRPVLKPMDTHCSSAPTARRPSTKVYIDIYLVILRQISPRS